MLLAMHVTDGCTSAERYVSRVCRRSFLSLWSHPNPYRKQGQTLTQLEGKELCDLLVICDDDVIIFSDKACEFPNTGNLQTDWGRWYRRAVEDPAKQIWGAERWLKETPQLIFADKRCATALPVPVPPADRARYHRVVVAHNSTLRNRAELGGTGSLMIMPDIIGRQHIGSADSPAIPFAVGRVDNTRGFVHILDDFTFGILLSELDTIADFTAYLQKKEVFIASGGLVAAGGEEDLLAYYFRNGSPDTGHTFSCPKGTRLALDSGLWMNYVANPRRAAKKAADQVSYSWDKLIDKFAHHLIEGTSLYRERSPGGPLDEAVRVLAREPRVRRRMLADAFIGLIYETVKAKRRARLVASTKPTEPTYIFVVVSREGYDSDEEYRQHRRLLLEAYCSVTKTVHPEARLIVGLATETEGESSRSEDLIVLDATDWSAEAEAHALSLREEFGILKKYHRREGTVEEFPEIPCWNCKDGTPRRGGRVGRNEQCPCGSGRKFKHCCLQAQN